MCPDAREVRFGSAARRCLSRRRHCRNCPTRPTNSTRLQKISAFHQPTFISARTPAKPPSSAQLSPITALSTGDKPGAEALSGLARSFFYAGARALLVSHWAVDSEAATRLATSTFDRLKADPKLGRAEALRQAMLAYLNDASSPRNAYPALWAPFALIGEGATR